MCGRYATTRTEADLSILFDAEPVTEELGPSWNVAPTDPVPVIRMSATHAEGTSAARGDASPDGVSAERGASADQEHSPDVRAKTSAERGVSPAVRANSPAEREAFPDVRANAASAHESSPAVRVVDAARWGLVPHWAKDLKAGARMINARAETVATSKAFARSFAGKRCLVPADGWFEWVRDGTVKRPFYMTPADGSVLAFAGIWSTWGPDRLLTCSVITTAALGELAGVHDRMPLILPSERWAGWLAGGGDPDELLRPMTPDRLAGIEIRPVRADVGNVRNNGPQLLEPPVDTTLF